MPKSMNSLVFPDVNLWLALSYERHPHFKSALAWYNSLPSGSRLVFCRTTQTALLRLLTNPAAMKEDVLTSMQAWNIYDRWLEEGPALLMQEPVDLDRRFRFLSKKMTKTPSDWTDAYLGAFAQAAGVQLVTFDKRLSQLAESATLLV